MGEIISVAILILLIWFFFNYDSISGNKSHSGNESQSPIIEPYQHDLMMKRMVKNHIDSLNKKSTLLSTSMEATNNYLKSPWNNILNSSEYDEEIKRIAKRFMIPDNISTDKFALNQKAFHYSGTENFKLATPSLKYGAAYVYRRFAFVLPDWFCFVYCDVVKWMDEDYFRVSDLSGPRYLQNNVPNEAFLRAVIQKYLHAGNKLECAI